MVEKVTKEGCTSKIKDMFIDADPYEKLPLIFPAMSPNLDSLFEAAAQQYPAHERDLTSNDIFSKLFLLDDRQQFVVVINDLKHCHWEAVKQQVAPLVKDAKSAGFAAYLLFAGGTTEEAEELVRQHGLDCAVMFGDEKLLKTMCRGNPSVFRLQQGKVLNKWHWRQLPAFNEIH
jgi:hypothetical protein